MCNRTHEVAELGMMRANGVIQKERTDPSAADPLRSKG